MTDHTRIRVGLTFHSVFYAPYFVAQERGLFAREGLEVEGEAFGDGRRVQAALARGDLDLGIGGVMRSMVGYDRGEEDLAIHFARLNDRDGFFLLGRSEPFDWPDLLGRRLILFSEAPTPWYVLRAFLLERGLDPTAIRVVPELPVALAAAAFRAGEADFIEAPAHVAEELVRDGVAIVLREMASEVGPLPYSSYAARPAYLERAPAAITALVRAHVAALAWMGSVDGAEIWAAIRPSFPDADPEVYGRAVGRYRRLGVWGSDATLPRASYERLADLLRRGGLIARVAPYGLVCRDDLTRAVIRMSRAHAPD